MSRTILKTPSSQNRGKAFSSSWFDTFTKFSTDLYIVKHSVTSFGIKRRKATCTSGTLADNINSGITVHDSIMPLWFSFYQMKDFDSNPE